LKSNSSSFWQTYFPDFALLFCTIIWGLSFTIMKDIIGIEISLGLFVFLRFLISSLIIFYIAGDKVAKLGRDGIIAGVILGILIFAGFATQTAGLIYTTASKSAFITSLSTAMIPVVLLVHRHRLPEPLVLSAILIAMVGMYMMTGPAGGEFNLGDLLTLLCAIIFGIQIYFMGIATLKYDSLGLTAVELGTTAILAACLLPFEKIIFIPSAKTIFAVGFLTIFATAFALTVQTWVQKKIPAVRAGLILTAEPLFAYMFAATLLGEQFNGIQKIGGLVIIAAILTSELLPVISARIKRDRKP
jgi:drug/metabolite transporter (DMT)-like permease